MWRLWVKSEPWREIMTKTATLLATALLALSILTAAHASIPPASEAQTAAKPPTQTNDEVALMPRDCAGCG
jgi:hypothetical protein